MKYRPFKSYLGRPLNLPTGNAWYEEDILNAERQFVKQFESPPTEIKVEANQGELWDEIFEKNHVTCNQPSARNLMKILQKDFTLIKK